MAISCGVWMRDAVECRGISADTGSGSAVLPNRMSGGVPVRPTVAFSNESGSGDAAGGPEDGRDNKKQKRNEGATEIVEIPDRGHALTIDSGWREVADTALAFVRRFA